MKKHYIKLGVMLCFTSLTFAQNINKASKNFDNLAYVNATEIYEKVVASGKESAEIYSKLGDAYFFNAQYEKAVTAYANLMRLESNPPAAQLYRYAVSLKSTGNYKDSDIQMDRFAKANATQNTSKLFVDQKNYLDIIARNSGRFTLEDAKINALQSDYGAAFYKDRLIFTTARDTGSFRKRVHKWTGEAFTTLHQATVAADGSLSDVKRFSSTLDTKYHESTPVFSPDGKSVYFTRNNYFNGKKGYDANKMVLLKIYSATLKDDKWTDIKELPFNSNDFNTAHPAISTDGKTLYFASDRPGTLGLSDLYSAAILGDNTFGEVTNLGPQINTEARETFPFIAPDGTLFFASDGHPGLGGLDIFSAHKDTQQQYRFVQNIGAPANSPYDDFSYAINANKHGYLTSNRVGGVGSDDIYRFTENKPLPQQFTTPLYGVMMDVETQEVMPNTTINIVDANFQNPIEVVTDSQGKFTIPAVDLNTKYYIIADVPGFEHFEKAVELDHPTHTTEVMNIPLERVEKPVYVGADLAKMFHIELIYFDLDKSNIRPDAAVELAKILEVMKQYPTLNLDIRSHTDSRATATYNEKLSSRRAASTKNWLVSQGISPDRLTSRGYGETQLVNDCADSVSCTEAQHQLNRRSEFIVTKI